MNFKSHSNAIPPILLLIYSGYLVYLIQTGVIITLPIALIFGFLVILYGYQNYMEHIKKPDAHAELEKKWEEYDAEVEKKLEVLRSGITKANMKNLKPELPSKILGGRW